MRRHVFRNRNSSFPTWRRFIAYKDEVDSEFRDVIEFHDHSNFATGRIDKTYRFIGLPFLNRVKGGKDAVVDGIKKIQKT